MRREKYHYLKASEIIKNNPLSNQYNMHMGWGITGRMHIGHIKEIMHTFGISRALKEKSEKDISIKVLLDDDLVIKSEKIVINNKEFFGVPEVTMAKDIPGLVDAFREEVEVILGLLNLSSLKPEYISNRQMYLDGLYNEYLKIAYDKYSEIQSTLEELASESKIFNIIKDEKIYREYELIGNYKLKYADGIVDIFNGNVKFPFRVEFILRKYLMDCYFESGGPDSDLLNQQTDLWYSIFNIKKQKPILDSYGLFTENGKKISKSKIINPGSIFYAKNFINFYGSCFTKYVSLKHPWRNLDIAHDKIIHEYSKFIDVIAYGSDEEKHHNGIDIVMYNEKPIKQIYSSSELKEKINNAFFFEIDELDFGSDIYNKYKELIRTEDKSFILDKEYIHQLKIAKDKHAFVRENGGFEKLYLTLFNKNSGPSLSSIEDRINKILI